MKGETWSDMETMSLINAWGDDAIRSKLNSSHRNASTFLSISQSLKKDGFSRTWQIETKLNSNVKNHDFTLHLHTG